MCEPVETVPFFSLSDESSIEMFVSSGQTTSDAASTGHVHSNDTVSDSLRCRSHDRRVSRKSISDDGHVDRDVQQLYNKVNNLAQEKSRHRLFAVIQLGNEQRKVTTEDIICKVDEFHPTIGDRIRFEKVGAV